MSNKKAAAIAEILIVRDQLVVMRERLFQLTAATAARTKKVDGLLIDCAGAGRVFGVRIGLPDWNNVLAMPAVLRRPNDHRRNLRRRAPCAFFSADPHQDRHFMIAITILPASQHHSVRLNTRLYNGLADPEPIRPSKISGVSGAQYGAAGALQGSAFERDAPSRSRAKRGPFVRVGFD